MRQTVLRTPTRPAPRRARWFTAAALAAGGAVAATLLVAPSAGAHGGAAHGPSAARRCGELARTVRLPHTTVTAAEVNTSGRFTVPPDQGGVGEAQPGTVFTGLPGYCAVSLVATNPPAHDRVGIEVWLPLDTWNGRLQGVGGGGFVSGISFRGMVAALRAGYATASTDTGHPASGGATGDFALGPDGRPDQAAITDFASRAVHEMTVAAKAVTRDLYGTPAHHSYFDGCSTGGRQALSEAQLYPHDYDGVVAGATAVDFQRLAPAQMWPQVVMRDAHDELPRCKQTAFQSAVITRCDGLDGVTDGVVADVAGCRFDARTLVGTATPCGTITATDARVMEEIWQGPRAPDGRRLWYGLEPGADTTFLARNDGTTGAPLFVADGWFRYWLAGDPDFDWTALTADSYARMSWQGVARYGELADDDPDLSAFRDAGGKLLLWTGLADPLIPPQGTIGYYDRVTRRMGGPGRTDSFARLFLAPGVGHCGATPGAVGADGPLPTDQLDAVTAWVEVGRAPASLPATKTDGAGGTVTRPLCAYPLVARYTGHGSTDDAANFRCARSFR